MQSSLILAAAHALSASFEGPWKIATLQPYSRDIVWSAPGPGGGRVTAHVQKRERPQIVFDSKLVPIALSNGVMPGEHPTPVSPGGHTGDWSYTHVQLFDRAT